jgi:hypothetical protein
MRELRDLSSMAIEHFDEEIAPLLREKEIALARSFHSKSRMVE